MHSNSSEPSNLKVFQSRKEPFAARLFTAARPGRSLGRAIPKISDETVYAWARGLLPLSSQLHIISLLGTKPNGLSEYSYYSFRGSRGSLEIDFKKPTFQEWLNDRFGLERFVVVDFPTIDTMPIEAAMITEICQCTTSLLMTSNDVLIVDSGGEGRTGKICSELCAVHRTVSGRGSHKAQYFLT